MNSIYAFNRGNRKNTMKKCTLGEGLEREIERKLEMYASKYDKNVAMKNPESTSAQLQLTEIPRIVRKNLKVQGMPDVN